MAVSREVPQPVRFRMAADDIAESLQIPVTGLTGAYWREPPLVSNGIIRQCDEQALPIFHGQSIKASAMADEIGSPVNSSIQPN